MGVRLLEQKSDKATPLDSISIPFLNTAGATDIRSMDSALAKLQQIASNVNRYVEKASIDIVRPKVYLQSSPKILKSDKSDCITN